MTDPVTTAVTTAVAAALATKAVAGLTEAGKTALAALARLVRRKLAANRQSSDILLHAERHPTSDSRREALAEALAQAMANDPDFAEQLATAWLHVEEGRTSTSHGTVHNVVSGDVDGSLLQARDIHGNVSFR